MPRKSRTNLHSKFQHVIVQGINKEYIFNSEKYILYYKKLILEKIKASNLSILAYCIMNNHAHFLIYCEKIEYLSKFMQKLNTSYSRFYNKENKRVGYVFRDRYLSQEILDYKQLYTCLKYIHNNPVKANMVKNISDYKYSSYKEFLGKKQIITDESLKLLFGTTSNYYEQFKLIHNKFHNETFFDLKDMDILEFASKFEEEYNKKIYEIKNDKILLKEFINQARDKTDITIRELAELLNISKSKVNNCIYR